LTKLARRLVMIGTFWSTSTPIGENGAK